MLHVAWIAAVVCAVVAFAPGASGGGPPVLPAYTSDGDSLIAFDRLTGDTIPVGPYALPDSWINTLAFSLDGRLFGIDDLSNRLVEIDLQSGEASVVGPLGIDLTSGGLAFDACGDLWFSTRDDGADNLLARLDPATGSAQVLSTGYPSRFGLATDGTRLLAVIGRGSQALYEVDRSSGELQLIASLDPPDLLWSQFPTLDLDGDGELWGLAALPSVPQPPFGVFTVDLESGALGSVVVLAATPFAGLAITPPGGSCFQPVVDVPAQGPFGGILLALMLGLASFVFLRRRRSAT